MGKDRDIAFCYFNCRRIISFISFTFIEIGLIPAFINSEHDRILLYLQTELRHRTETVVDLILQIQASVHWICYADDVPLIIDSKYNLSFAIISIGTDCFQKRIRWQIFLLFQCSAFPHDTFSSTFSTLWNPILIVIYSIKSFQSKCNDFFFRFI